MRAIFAFLLIATISLPARAATIIELTPDETRFVAMRANKVNARSGPGSSYPIEWIYQQQYYPVEIIAEYGQWRKVRDYEGAVTWILKNLLTNTRYALVIEPGENNIYEKDSRNSDVIARAENGVIAAVKRCTLTSCLLEFNDKIKGWMPRSVLYGIKKGEIIE